MANAGFPMQHTTITMLQTSNIAVVSTIRFDPSYLRTLPGLLQAGQLVLNLLGFICIETSGVFAYDSLGSWFNVVAITGFWFTKILLIHHLFHIVEKFDQIPWLKIEFSFCVIWAGLYLMAASLAVAYVVEAYKAAGFFGFCAMVLYGFDAFFKLQDIKSLPKIGRVIKGPTTNIRPPAY